MQEIISIIQHIFLVCKPHNNLNQEVTFKIFKNLGFQDL